MLEPMAALVEIGPDNIWALLLAFLLLMASIALIAGLIVTAIRRKAGPGGVASWSTSRTFTLPVSKSTFDRLSGVVAKGVERPPVTPQRRANLDWLPQARKTFTHIYRGLLFLAGGAGLTLAYVLYADATPGNMQLLPAGIIALLSAGALLSALFPSRAVTGDIEPIDPRLLEKIQVTVGRPAETTFRLDQAQIDMATGLFADGWDADNVARSVVPDYDALPDEIKHALQSMLRQAVDRSKAN